MNQYLKNHPFWCISSLFCLGVFLSSYSEKLLLITIITVVPFSIFIFYLRSRNTKNYFFYATAVLFFLLGLLRFQIALPKYQTNHIVHLKDNDQPQKITLGITEIFKASEKAWNYKVKIHSINNSKKKGYALLSIPKKTTISSYHLGDTFITFTKLKSLKTTGNPYAFEYSDYLKNQHITHKIWVTNPELHKIKSPACSWIKFSNKIRNHIETSLKKQPLSTEVLQITEALVLGNKYSINPTLKKDFANAGVIHILAISGLHIGILYLLLNGIFSLISPYSKNNIYAAISIVMLLWIFAWFSGASPSALRATTMFTCFQFTKLSQRHQHPLNALFVSTFILVFVDPFILFSVGFQLSITAVAAIIIGVPKLLTFWYPKNWLTNKIWSIICMSACAQVGILPLSIYYFHQFSSLFLLANIPIMMVITFVLSGAIIVVVCSSFSTLPIFIINFYNEFILVIIKYVSRVANLETFILKECYINSFSLLFCYLFMFYLGYTYNNPRKGFKWSLPILTLGILMCFWEYQQRIFKNELWLLNTYNNTILTESTSNKIGIYSKNKLSSTDINYLIKPIVGNLHYTTFNTSPLLNSYKYFKYPILIINSKNQLPQTSEKAIFILDNSPKINIERLINEHQPQLIIATAKNYSNLVKKWKATCSKEQVAFYNISENGALNLTLTHLKK